MPDPIDNRSFGTAELFDEFDDALWRMQTIADELRRKFGFDLDADEGVIRDFPNDDR